MAYLYNIIFLFLHQHPKLFASTIISFIFSLFLVSGKHAIRQLSSNVGKKFQKCIFPLCFWHLKGNAIVQGEANKSIWILNTNWNEVTIALQSYLIDLFAFAVVKQ